MRITWRRRRATISYIRSSLWLVPVGAGILEQIIGRIVLALDANLAWPGLGWGMAGAKVIFDSIITLSLSFIVFTFGSLLVAIQVASGQYTPRIIATTLLSDNVIRNAVGLFVFTFLISIQGANHAETTVPQLMTFAAGALGMASIVAFLFLIDYAARLLRPVSLVARVARDGLAVLASVYPEPLAATPAPLASRRDFGPVRQTIAHRGASATVLAVDVGRLLAEAKKANGVIEFVPQVGDFVGTDEPLFLMRGANGSVDERVLRECVVFGSERTIEQDPLFAFRILVDIAIKALSAAINDPTTAVLAIDQLQRLLHRAGASNLRTDYIRGPEGNVRVIFRTPDWDDFVQLAFSEIRFYGAENVQIARRLRAMILNLGDTLPPERLPALQQQLDLLDRTLKKLHALPEDLALARVPDSQGLGGSTDSDGGRWASV